MENYREDKGTSWIVPSRPVKQGGCDDNPLAECRNLVYILAKKTERLYREFRSDQEKAMHLRAMESTLACLTDRVNKLDHDARILHREDIIGDARGFTYQSVRSCDLDRIIDK